METINDVLIWLEPRIDNLTLEIYLDRLNKRHILTNICDRFIYIQVWEAVTGQQFDYTANLDRVLKREADREVTK